MAVRLVTTTAQAVGVEELEVRLERRRLALHLRIQTRPFKGLPLETAWEVVEGRAATKVPLGTVQNTAAVVEAVDAMATHRRVLGVPYLVLVLVAEVLACQQVIPNLRADAVEPGVPMM